jgi:hypothetical protein
METVMYIVLISASPLAMILNLSTTVRCEHIAEEGELLGRKNNPHHLCVVSSV